MRLSLRPLAAAAVAYFPLDKTARLVYIGNIANPVRLEGGAGSIKTQKGCDDEE